MGTEVHRKYTRNCEGRKKKKKKLNSEMKI